MNAMSTKRKTKIVLLFIICFANLTVLIIPQTPLTTIGTDDIMDERKFPYTIKAANNDTDAPVIVFIKPDINDTTVTGKFYEIIVNITDDNPPLPGNVSIEISNATTSLFNASMIKGVEWFFIWDNITSYPNHITYFFKVTAIDSSVNENIGMSGVIYIYVAVYSSNSPGFLYGILHIIIASMLIACILVYFNKKRAGLSFSRQ